MFLQKRIEPNSIFFSLYRSDDATKNKILIWSVAVLHKLKMVEKIDLQQYASMDEFHI